jgi:hypothetical protein
MKLTNEQIEAVIDWLNENKLSIFANRFEKEWTSKIEEPKEKVFTDEEVKRIHELAGMLLLSFLSNSNVDNSKSFQDLYVFSYNSAEGMILESRKRNNKYENQKR